MADNEKKGRRRMPLKTRLMVFLFLMTIPLTCMVLWILSTIQQYSNSYNRIMANLKVANEYNMKFKEDMEYSMYRVLIGLIDTADFEKGDIIEGRTQYATIVKNPNHMIAEAREDFSNQLDRTLGADSDIKVKGILSCLDSLETAVNKMIGNTTMPRTYDEGKRIWENDIQGLCSMIQDYINQYIYYETLKMEGLQKELESHTRRIIGSFLMVLSAVLGGGFAISAMIAKSVTNPIHHLTKTAKRLGQGELLVRADEGGLEEINVLARTFNKMSDEIAALMEKTREEQKQLWLAELKLRQEQINPHFLYNTLDSIIWMAEGGNDRQVVAMTSDLSDFFRTVLSEGRDFITIAEEEAHVRSYMKIQKVRYEDILSYQIDIDSSIKECIVLKMILQPIVENALYHGIKNKRGGGTIFVRGYEDGNGIVFEVEDDGIGMDESKLAALREKVRAGGSMAASGKGGFGLRNVALRIRMYYGEGADIMIESQKNIGTQIKVYLGHTKADNKKIPEFQNKSI